MSLFNSVNQFSSNFGGLHLPFSKTGGISTVGTGCQVSVDWLQVFLLGKVESRSGFDVVEQNMTSRHFRKLSNLFYCGELIGSLAYEPHSSVIRPDGVLLKLANPVLYKYQPFELVSYVCKALGLKFNNISRLDLALDFNNFAYGLDPSNLIKGFCTGKYLKVGKSKYKVFGEVGDVVSFDYLRFGGNTSEFSVYLYNKSKELSEVKDKPYIREKAKQYGVDVDQDFYRLEVSVKSPQIKMISKDTGEISDYGLKYFDNPGNITDFFKACVERYFRFKHNAKQENKSRLKDVQLFVFDIPDVIIQPFKNTISSKRSHKIFIKHLEMYNNEMRGIGFHETLDRDKVLQDYVQIHDLTKYYYFKVKGATFPVTV